MNNQPQHWQNSGLAILRIISGLLMAYHGLEVFNSTTMDGYIKWDAIKSLPAPVFMVYLGKILELLSGVLLTVGLFTRPAALFMAISMLIICFKVGNGKFYYEDQHPFIFAMLAMVFFFCGPVKWSLDQLIHKPRNTYHSY
ncbi:MAG: DoxX family protein [Ferruginibacter sp.]|nr:DoxX family protein [Chitinophagaceae bacterium]